MTETELNDLVAQMTLEEKVSLLAGASGWSTHGIERLGLGPCGFTDGPHGVTCWVGHATCFPVSIALAATWNPELVREVGAALGRETRAAGRDVLLGPCVNIHRHPLGGRNFESFGEDPFLAGQMAVAYIRGVQGEGVAACVKHFACNNQETDRNTVNVEVDERTLREIYLPAFEFAVREAGVKSVMAAYNRVNGAYCCENAHLLTDILKHEWRFDGFVVSDWGACHSTVPSALAGLDLEMDADGPGRRQFFSAPLREAVRRGDVTLDVLDDKVRRLLRVFGGLRREPREVDPGDHARLALQAAREAIVLLKNDGVLPFDLGHVRTVAVVGPNAAAARLGGGGSSTVSPPYAVSLLDGLRAIGGDRLRVQYARGALVPDDLIPVPPEAFGPEGLQAELFDNLDLAGAPAVVRRDAALDFVWGVNPPAPGISSPFFSVRWRGRLTPPETGRYYLGVTRGAKFRLYLDGRLLQDAWASLRPGVSFAEAYLERGRSYDLCVEYRADTGWAAFCLGWLSGGDLLREAVNAAREADAAIVAVGLSRSLEGEGWDRCDLELPPDQDKLIAAVAEANPNTVVVLIAGSPVGMASWIGKVRAVLVAWYPGQEGGRALAEVLFGQANPCGKLPMTFPRRIEDCPAFGNFPGAGGRVAYREGIFVGYRHYDARGVEPLFPFGHGLSYTDFEWSDLDVRADPDSPQPRVTARCALRNVGPRAGAEVVQVYVRDVASRLERPPKELKAFRKVLLAPGERRELEFELGPRAFAFFDVARGGWVVEPGEFEILVGSSSRDIRLRGRVTLSSGCPP